MKRKTGKFVKGRRENIEKRERISFRKDSRRYPVGVKNQVKSERTTVSGSRRPGVKTGYAQELRGIPVEKAYGDQGHMKGMNKRPRRNLTLGNILIRKNRKRVEGIESKNLNLVGVERLRQRIRGRWDKRNLERRKTQRKYRKSGEIRGRSSEVEKKEREGLINGRELYLLIRECEVYRNEYERRSRYEKDERGQKRKEWWLEKKYPYERRKIQSNRLKPNEKGKGKKTPGVLETRRKNRKKSEIDVLNGFYKEKHEEVKKRLNNEYERRVNRCNENKARRKLKHVKILRERCKQSLLEPRKRKNREKRERELDLGEKKKNRVGKSEREVLMVVPTTQYFAKRKNRKRMIEIQLVSDAPISDEPISDEQISDAPITDYTKKSKIIKWRKVSEKERIERKPEWLELDVWINRRMQKVEDENRKRLLVDSEQVEKTYKGLERKKGKYMELGKEVRYIYGAERSERWKKIK